MKRFYLPFVLTSLLFTACAVSNDDNIEAESQLEQEPASRTQESDSTPIAAEMKKGLNISLFLEGALAEEATTTNCKLSDGTETTCHSITIAGLPANHDVGPFCPETTATGADDAGIWFDGSGVYDIDGEFILGLAERYGDDNWKLYDDDGNVRITETPEAFDAAARPDVGPDYQNYCVEGKIEWLDGGEPVQTTVMIPTTPVMAASTIPARGNLGITLHGVVIDGPAPVAAILGAYTIAAFDDCGGHINPFEGYHLHGARGCSEVGEAVSGETPIFAYAMDGHAIHSPLSEAAAADADLDECNGHVTDELGYHYHALPAEGNAVLTCLKGVTVQGSTRRSGPGAGPGPGPRG